ncbi:MAG TPA: ABC transporter permease [Dehalococcoidia bacterium]|nr:ABC transporter permease [Dehalococcoidia bacterium]
MIRVEFAKQILRLRTLITLGIMAAMPTIMTIALELRNRQPHDNDLFALASHSGLNMPIAALSVMTNFLLPAVVAIYAGSAIAEEATWGSLRYLLLRPVSRNRVLISKLTVVIVLSLAAAIIIVTTGIIEGVVAFGWKPVLTPSLTEVQPGAAFLRLIAGMLYVAWSMSGIIALGFMLSTLTDSTMGAVSGAVGVAILSEILVEITPLGSIRTILPTYHWHAWESLFATPVVTSHMAWGVLLQVPYVVAFLGAGWWWFHRKDILC